jgi:UDP-2,3-diacylglucosamine hydrolase
MSTLFISDLHLEDSVPDTTACLLDFLHGPAREAEAVYILGDLFEYWIGDDALSETARQVAAASAELGSCDVPCFFMHGNRDFLLGDAFASKACMTLLPESVVIDLYGTPTLLLHGDSLCTDDIEYQAFRRQARNPAWQAAVLALSIDERLEMARNARDASQHHTGTASMEIMDVNEAAVRAGFREHGVSRMIHGHTHRPAKHRYELDNGTVAERIVLADWYSKGSYLKVTADRVQSVDLASFTPSD